MLFRATPPRVPATNVVGAATPAAGSVGHPHSDPAGLRGQRSTLQVSGQAPQPEEHRRHTEETHEAACKQAAA